MQQKHLYKEAVEKVNEYFKEHPETTRADRFRIIHELTGIDEEFIRSADRWGRAIREIYPKTKIGAKLEQEWKNTPVTREVESWSNIFKHNNPLQ